MSAESAHPVPGRWLVAAAVGLLLMGAATACDNPFRTTEEAKADARAEYCKAVRSDADEISRIVAEGGPAAFIKALPVLETLGEKSPSDLRDEWQTFLNALEGLRDALDETGVDPDEMTGGELPKDLSAADRRRIRSAASVLAGADVRAATEHIEQHALDICKTPLL